MHRISQYKLQLVREGSFPYADNIILEPEDAAQIFQTHFDGSDREVFSFIALNIKHKVIGIHDVSVGSLTASVVHPREVFKAAMLMNAAALIVAHCHPSGNVTPSSEDVRLTIQLIEAGKLLDIPIIDHVITGTDKEVHTAYCSMKEEGIIK
ncbi:MAG: hypothetical protein J6M33_05305 [Anaerovibrio sp.]|nr:hypothetical protein [Anaerovibrio sp.]